VQAVSIKVMIPRHFHLHRLLTFLQKLTTLIVPYSNIENKRKEHTYLDL